MISHSLYIGYEETRSTLFLLKLLFLAEEDIRNGNTHSEEDVFEAVEELLNLPHHDNFGFETKC